MEEKDRHIVTFGEEGSTTESSGGSTLNTNFTYDTNIPSAGDARQAAGEAPQATAVTGETTGSGFTMKPSEPAAGSAGSAAGSAAPQSAAGTAAQDRPAVRQEAPSVSTTVEPDYTARRMASEGPSHVKAMPKKEKKYVTKGALVLCMVITMILSALLGAFLGGAFSGRSSASDGRAARNDSDLSELNLSDATGSELTVSEIIDKNADAVVEIVVEGTEQGMWGQMQLVQGAGSGVIVKEDGYIATNNHVVEGANKVEVTLHNGEVYNATVVGTDPENDIAVIKIDASGLTTAVIGDSSKVAVGDLAVAIGNPLGQLGGTATSGIISALDRTLEIEGTTLTLLQTDAAINGGNSGGGLFNGSGELIGIVESKASAVGVEGLAFALPINSVSGIINDMIENGGTVETGRSTPAVGVVISEVSEDNAQYYGLDSAGVYIAQVTGSNAQKAGFKEQDRIVSIDGEQISTSSEFISIVRSHKVGDTVTIVVSRNGQELEIKTELEELQSNN